MPETRPKMPAEQGIGMGRNTRAARGLAAGLMLVLMAACAEKELVLEGPRYPVDADLTSVATDAQGNVAAPAQPANRSVPISVPAGEANASWTQRGGNVRHVSPPGRLSAQPVLVWSSPIGEGNGKRARIQATPVAGGGLIYAMDSGSQVTAVSAASGAPAWSVDVTADFDRGGGTAGGGLAYHDGRLYVSTVSGELVVLDAKTGGVIWRKRLDVPAAGAPAVEGNSVYVVLRNGTAWAMDAADGKIRWQGAGTPSQSGVVGGGAPAVAGDRVILPFESGDVSAYFARSGQQLWASGVGGERVGRPYASFSEVTGDPVVVGNTVFVGTSGGRTAAIDMTSGQVLWNATEGALNPVLPVGGSLFQVTDDGRLVRMDAGSGEVIWAVQMPYFTNPKPQKTRRNQAIYAHYGPVAAGGRIVVASSDGLLRVFDPRDGRLVSTAAIPDGAASAPILTNSMLYVMGGDGQLHAFR